MFSDTTSDEQIAELLALLAEDEEEEAKETSDSQTHVLSQAVAHRLQQLEEQDSILSEVKLQLIMSHNGQYSGNNENLFNLIQL